MGRCQRVHHTGLLQPLKLVHPVVDQIELLPACRISSTTAIPVARAPQAVARPVLADVHVVSLIVHL